MTNKTPNRFETLFNDVSYANILEGAIEESDIIIILESLRIASDLEDNPYGGTSQEPFDMEPVTAWRNRTCKPDITNV